MSVLPDYLIPNLRVVFCGTAAGERSAARGHYYSGPGNKFWPLLHDSRILPVPFGPEMDMDVLGFGIGLTDLAQKRSASRDDRLSRGDFDLPVLIEKMQRYQPGWLAFHGKKAAQETSRGLGFGRKVSLGRQEWTVGGVRVFVVPSGSGSNQNPANLEGKPSRLAWFQELAAELPEWTDADQSRTRNPAKGE